MACELAGEADWQSGRLPGFSRRGWARRHHRGYWRLRRSLEALAQAGVLAEGKGEATLDLDRLRHQRGDQDGPPFVQLLPGAVEAYDQPLNAQGKPGPNEETHLPLRPGDEDNPEAPEEPLDPLSAYYTAVCGAGWLA